MYSLRLEQSIAAIIATCSLYVATKGPAVPPPGQPADDHAARLLCPVHDPRRKLPASASAVAAATVIASEPCGCRNGCRPGLAACRRQSHPADAPQAIHDEPAGRRRPQLAGSHVAATAYAAEALTGRLDGHACTGYAP